MENELNELDQSKQTCKVKVSYFGPLRAFTRRTDEELTFPENSSLTVRTVLAELSKRYGDVIEELMIYRGQMNHGVRIFVNGESIVEKNDLDTPLHTGSELQMMLVMAAQGG